MMEVKVNEQTERFYLAINGWVPVVGHEIKVGKYSFCAIPNGDVINISEVTSGMKIKNIKVNPLVVMMTSTKEDAMSYFESIGRTLAKLVETQPNIDDRVREAKEHSEKLFGKMPERYAVDIDWILEESNGTH